MIGLLPQAVMAVLLEHDSMVVHLGKVASERMCPWQRKVEHKFAFARHHEQKACKTSTRSLNP
jgi:hypothetical protein